MLPLNGSEARALTHDGETVEGFQLLWENIELTPALRALPCIFVRGRPIGETNRAPALKTRFDMAIMALERPVAQTEVHQKFDASFHSGKRGA